MQESTYTILNNTTFPTFNYSAHNFCDTLDYVIANRKTTRFVLYYHLSHNIGSDHLPLTTKLLNKYNHRTLDENPNAKTQSTPRYKIEDTHWDDFNTVTMSKIEDEADLWPPSKIKNTTQINSIATKLTTLVNNTIDKVTPRMKPANIDKPRLPSSILILIRSRRQLRKQYTASQPQHVRVAINGLNKLIKSEIENLKNKIITKQGNII